MVLRKGSRGYQVKLLQTKLKKLGYHIDVDGSFGNGTKSVLKAFQRDNILKIDGIYGPNSQRTIKIAKQMKYQEFWINRQIQVVKMNRSHLTADLINVKRSTVKSLWKSLKRKPTLLINGGLFNTKSMDDLNKMVDEYKNVGAGYYSKEGIKIANDRKISFGLNNNDRDFLGGSPALILNSKHVNEDKFHDLDHGFIKYKHPRVGVGANESYVYVVVYNGRNKWKRWYGANLSQLAQVFDDLGCTDAMNLDGGGSISAVTKLGLYFKVGYRKVANMLAFYLD